MKRMIWTMLPLLAILSAPPLASAQTSEMGVVDDVQVKREALVVDDQWYPLAPGYLVHGAADGKLEKKMKIAFTTRKTDEGRKMITEVWVLPPGFVFPAED